MLREPIPWYSTSKTLPCPAQKHPMYTIRTAPKGLSDLPYFRKGNYPTARSGDRPTSISTRTNLLLQILQQVDSVGVFRPLCLRDTTISSKNQREVMKNAR